jgi:hypothetical protein
MQLNDNEANIQNISGQSKQSLQTDVDKSRFKSALTKFAWLNIVREIPAYEKTLQYPLFRKCRFFFAATA